MTTRRLFQRLFQWEYQTQKYPAGDWRNRENPYWIGKYQGFTARVVHHSNRVEYTYEIDWPSLATGVNRYHSGEGCDNETTTMLLADRWLYLHLHPEAK